MINNRFRQILCSVILIGAFLLLTTTPSATQTQENVKVFRISETLKVKLIKRIHQFIEYDRTRQYEKLYELHLPDFAHKMFIAKNKEEYARIIRESGEPYEMLIGFVPMEFAMLSDTEYGEACRIYGLAKHRIGGKEEESYRISWAIIKDGEWYFVDFWELLPD
jgi:hypothetical protein